MDFKSLLKEMMRHVNGIDRSYYSQSLLVITVSREEVGKPKRDDALLNGALDVAIEALSLASQSDNETVKKLREWEAKMDVYFRKRTNVALDIVAKASGRPSTTKSMDLLNKMEEARLRDRNTNNRIKVLVGSQEPRGAESRKLTVFVHDKQQDLLITQGRELPPLEVANDDTIGGLLYFCATPVVGSQLTRTHLSNHPHLYKKVLPENVAQYDLLKPWSTFGAPSDKDGNDLHLAHNTAGEPFLLLTISSSGQKKIEEREYSDPLEKDLPSSAKGFMHTSKKISVAEAKGKTWGDLERGMVLEFHGQWTVEV